MGKRKRIDASENGDSCSEDEGEVDTPNAMGSQSEDYDEGDDPCCVSNGKAVNDTALNSDNEESSSDQDYAEDEEEWELTLSSDEEEGDATEELPSSRSLQTATNKNLMEKMRRTGWEYGTFRIAMWLYDRWNIVLLTVSVVLLCIQVTVRARSNVQWDVRRSVWTERFSLGIVEDPLALLSSSSYPQSLAQDRKGNERVSRAAYS